MQVQLPGNSVPLLFQHLDSGDFGSKPFVVLHHDVLTYGALREAAERTGRLFRESAIGAGDRIVICTEHDLEAIMLYVAALRFGVTAVLVDPHASLDEAKTLVRAAEAKALFVDRRLFESLELAGTLLRGGRVFETKAAGPYDGADWASKALRVELAGTYPAMLADYERLAAPSLVPGDTSAFILFTSGTTSRPKGVEVAHGAMAAHFATMHRQYGYDTESRVINGLPLHHSDGINHGVMNILAAGGTLYRTGPFTVQRLPEILDMVKRHGITHMITVPTILALISRLGDEFRDAFRTESFRFVSSTAGPLDERLWRGFEERFGTMVVNSYGLTETICEGFYCGPTPDTRRIGTIGKPIDIDVRVIDDSGEDVAEGQMGELLLRGTCLMKGYYKAPEETAAVLRDGWLHTGDLAVRDADGFYSIVGRKKNVIITGGLNVYPEDVSRTLLRMPGIADAVTFGLPDDTWGERVVSCVVAMQPGTVSSEDVVTYCRAHLSREKVPSEVVVLEDLPRGPAGKVALPEVRKLVLEMRAVPPQTPAAGAAPASDDIAKRVLEVAAAAFNMPVGELSLDSQPETTAGWTSIAHVDYLIALEATFGVVIAPEDMLTINTIGDAVDYIRRTCGAAREADLAQA